MGSVEKPKSDASRGSLIYKILKVQLHTTAARKESPRTARSRPTLNVGRLFAARPLSPHTVPYTRQTTDTQARAGHPHALALDPTAAVRVRPARAHPRAPHTASRRVLGGHECVPRAPPHPPQHARSTSSTHGRGAADGDGVARGHRQAAAKPPPGCPPRSSRMMFLLGLGEEPPACANAICGPNAERSASQTACDDNVALEARGAAAEAAPCRTHPGHRSHACAHLSSKRGL